MEGSRRVRRSPPVPVRRVASSRRTRMARELKQDPTEAALSAVEQALSTEFPARGEEAAEDTPSGPRLPEVSDNELGEASGPRAAPAPIAPPAARRPAEERAENGVVAPDRSAVANDDRRDVGALLQALQARASRTPYVLAALAAIAWAAIFVALTAAQGIDSLGALRATFTPVQLAVGGIALLGPMLFFVIAPMMTVPAHEMRLVARAVGEVAIRLSEPEGMSTDAVLTVSQAVRREVAAVGDGVERALARAGELETLVRSEISTLERAYSDNEIRIRSLIDELVAQREAIVSNAERVRGSITGAHQTLIQDLDGASERVIAAVSGAGDKVTSSLETQGDHITQALGRAGERVVDEIVLRGNEFRERLATTAADVASEIDQRGVQVREQLESAVRLADESIG